MSVDEYLARALASMVASVELSDDDEIDPDTATKILEPVGAILQEMDADDRRQLSMLMETCAQREANPNRREIIQVLPEAFGLL